MGSGGNNSEVYFHQGVITEMQGKQEREGVSALHVYTVTY